MHRIDSSGATETNQFTEGDPSSGVPATQVTDDWLNATQEELCNAIEGAGLELDKADNSQLVAALQVLINAALQSSTFGDDFLGFHTGLALSWESATKITVAPGNCRNTANDGFIYLAAALTKQISANWVAGDEAGGFPSGLTLAADTFYRVFAIWNPTTETADAGIDTSATAANLLSDASGYTKYRQVGWVLTDSSSQIVKFFADDGGRVVWDVSVFDRAGAAMTIDAELVNITAPPGAIADLLTHFYVAPGSDVTRYGLLTETRQTDTSPSSSAFSCLLTKHTYGPQTDHVQAALLVDSNSQIRARGSAADINCGIQCLGYTFLWD